jgi:hypothetical protein
MLITIVDLWVGAVSLGYKAAKRVRKTVTWLPFRLPVGLPGRLCGLIGNAAARRMPPRLLRSLEMEAAEPRSR